MRTEQDIKKELSKLYSIVSRVSRGSGHCNMAELLQAYGTSVYIFGRSCKTKEAEAMRILLSESMLARQKSLETGETFFRPLHPAEDFDAWLANYKYDRRQERTKQKQEPFKNKYDIESVLKLTNLKAKDLAKKIGISDAMISRIRRGHTRMTDDITNEIKELMKNNCVVETVKEVPLLKHGWARSKQMMKRTTYEDAKSLTINVRGVIITIQF